MLCVIKECSSDAVKTGLCSAHYKKRAKGDYSVSKQKQCRGTFDEKFRKYTKRMDSGCLLWIGPIYNGGYGRINYGKIRTQAHRALYIHRNGPIKPKHHVHHICENKSCVEIKHLKLISHSLHSKLHQCPRDKMGRMMAHKNS